MHDRHCIRSTMRRQREQLTPQMVCNASVALCDYIRTTPWFRQGHRIAFYAAMPGELDLFSLVRESWRRHKTCYLPVCFSWATQRTLRFFPYTKQTPLFSNRWGISEPRIHLPAVPVWTLDIVFIPLLAFDRAGHRLGYGKGFYDRTLARLNRFSVGKKPLLVGVAYAFQGVDQLPAQPWDVPLDKIVMVTV